MDKEQVKSPELVMLLNNKESGYNYRERRHEDWRENYTLYRDKVIVNRLTQRQTVNVPMMKMLIRTLLKDVDDMPLLYFENLDNDKQSELFQNEYWKWTSDLNNMELQDIVDKRQVFHFGRSFDQWQIKDGFIRQTVQDPQDMLVSRFTDPFNLHSSRFLIHQHIFIPLSVLKRDGAFNQNKVANIEKYFRSTMGIIKQNDNQDSLVAKNQKMRDMGVDDIEDPVLGETYVEISLHFVWQALDDDEEEQIYLYVEAENQEILMRKPLEEVIGTTEDHFWRTHFPYVSWADDVERQDFWSDGGADIIRGSNIVLNTWLSQLVENRTMRSFGMNYYNSTDEDFVPGTFEPRAWGWYPIPGNPNELIQRVDIPDLSESLDEMNFVIQMVEKATGATATAQGAQTERSITLGEVQLALGEAKERIKGMSKFYTPAWKQRGMMFLKLIEAAPEKLNIAKIYKKGKHTDDLYEKAIEPNDWMTKAGYRVKIWSQEEKDAQDSNSLQKLSAVKQIMPGNSKVDEVYKMKLLEFADFNPEEINEAMEIERAQQEAVQGQAMMGAGGQPGSVPQQMPQQPMLQGGQVQ